MLKSIKKYFRDIWYDINEMPFDFIDCIRARDSYHWIEFKFSLGTLRRDITHPIWCIRRGVVNLFRWFKVIWFDRDYDHCFIAVVMEKKLQFMEEAFTPENTHCNSAKHTRKQIKYARKLLNYTFDYPTPNLDAFYVKWGELKFEHVVSQTDSLGKPMTYEMVHNTTPEYDVEWKEAHKKDLDLEKNIDKHLWRFIDRKIKYWWD